MWQGKSKHKLPTHYLLGSPRSQFPVEFVKSKIAKLIPSDFILNNYIFMITVNFWTIFTVELLDQEVFPQNLKRTIFCLHFTNNKIVDLNKETYLYFWVLPLGRFRRTYRWVNITALNSKMEIRNLQLTV